MSSHTEHIIKTSFMGTWFQASCGSCGWLAPVSRKTRAEAQADYAEHLKKNSKAS